MLAPRAFVSLHQKMLRILNITLGQSMEKMGVAWLFLLGEIERRMGEKNEMWKSTDSLPTEQVK